MFTVTSDINIVYVLSMNWCGIKFVPICTNVIQLSTITVAHGSKSNAIYTIVMATVLEF